MYSWGKFWTKNTKDQNIQLSLMKRLVQNRVKESRVLYISPSPNTTRAIPWPEP